MLKLQQRRERLRPDQGHPRRQPAGAQGEIATVLGSNGAGKSTILKTISGIIDPAQGQHRVQGRRHHRARPGL
jgi:ABC-type sulfate/molybdate transport systems ATPase subunit